MWNYLRKRAHMDIQANKIISVCQCLVHIVGRHDGKVFDERDVTFNQGEGAEHGLVEAVDLTVLKMNKGETAR